MSFFSFCFYFVRPPFVFSFFFFNDTATTEIYTLSLHDALPISFVRDHAVPSSRARPRETAGLGEGRHEGHGARGHWGARRLSGQALTGGGAGSPGAGDPRRHGRRGDGVARRRLQAHDGWRRSRDPEEPAPGHRAHASLLIGLPRTSRRQATTRRRTLSMHWSRMSVCATAAGLLLFSFVTPSPSWAYRPFISTDAAVADPKEVEIEIGYFTLERTKDENAFIIPRVVFNYGWFKDWELVAEFAIRRAPDAEVNVIDPGIFLKGVLKEGVLQDKDGFGFAIEAGPLLPATEKGDRKFGFDAIGILSA